MQSIPRSIRRLALFLLSLPLVALALAVLYQEGMAQLEHTPRTLGESMQWAVATMTTTGFGRDTTWSHPLMAAFVIVAEFVGVTMIFLIFPVFIIPLLEERFEARLPSTIPALDGEVFIYRYGPAVTSLLDELERADVATVIFEEDEAVARRLHEQGHRVLFGSMEDDDPDLHNLAHARAVVANGDDEENAAMALSARYHGFTGPILAMVDNPARRTAMLRAGATTAFTPTHVLAAAIAARASHRLSPRISGVRHLGAHLDVSELRIHSASALAGHSIRESNVRSRTGATIVGLWLEGRFVSQPNLDTQLGVGTIIVAVGSDEGIARLGALATPVHRDGVLLVVGNTIVGRKAAEILRLADEEVRVIDEEGGEGVDIIGDPLDPDVLARAGAGEARAVVLALDSDSATLFAAALVRSLTQEVLIVAAASRAENVARIHRAGADFALSIGQVAGQLLAFHLLGQESVSLEAALKLVATSPGSLVGQKLATRLIRERTGCSVAAVERDDVVHVEFDGTFRLEANDVVYLCGTSETLARYFREFPGTRTLTRSLTGDSLASMTEERAVGNQRAGGA
ncbi:MAG: NAD-binding protein [Gemmatimonadota bacterium]